MVNKTPASSKNATNDSIMWDIPSPKPTPQERWNFRLPRRFYAKSAWQ
ncbi:hypothetical protein [Helicobacter sp. T3_23-1059]